MIGRLLSYPYANARSRALATRLLADPEIVDLTKSHTLEQATTLLERRFPSPKENHSLEYRLHSDYLAFGQLILKTLPEAAENLLRTYLERSWVENLLVLCRIVFQLSPEVDRPQPLPVLPPSSLPELDEVSTLDELAARLPTGPYRAVLQGNGAAARSDGLAALENRLLLTYWQAVAAATARLPALDRFAAAEILGFRADIDALRILRRGRQAALDVDRVLQFWPPLARLFDPARLRRVLRSDNPDAGLRQLLARAVVEESNGDHLEAALCRRLRRELRRGLVSPPFDITVPLSALLLKELEVMDLTGILAGLRFGLAPAEVSSLVSRLEG